MTTAAHRDQAEFWESDAGPKWVRHADALDSFFDPVTRAVLAKAGLEPGETVADIGCGSGSSTLLAAEGTGMNGAVQGIDISQTLLDLARKRASDRNVGNVTFMHADAAVHPFSPEHFDAMISRFGVMFFDDPVSAFANMTKALKPGGRMVFAAWGQVAANPFFTISAAAIRKIFGEAPPRPDLDAPGPFAFRNPDRVLDILHAAGLNDARVDIRQIPLPINVGVDGLVDLWTDIGPMERAFAHFSASAQQREAVRDEVRKSLQDHVSENKLTIPSEINICSAGVAASS
jgi:SAM-dependent methyltransferase